MLSFGRWLLASAALSPLALSAMTLTHGDDHASMESALDQRRLEGTLASAEERSPSGQGPVDFLVDDAMDDPAVTSDSPPVPNVGEWALLGLGLTAWGLKRSRRHPTG